MEWSGWLAVVIAGVAGLLIISLLYWSGHALLNRLGDVTPPKSAILQSPADRPSAEQPAYISVPAGQERLATQAERDDVNDRIERFRSSPSGRSVQL
jgi:hypothetical protein